MNGAKTYGEHEQKHGNDSRLEHKAKLTSSGCQYFSADLRLGLTAFYAGYPSKPHFSRIDIA